MVVLHNFEVKSYRLNIVCLCIFIVPAGTLWLPWLKFFHAFFSVVRQMPGYNSQRRGTARTLPKVFVLFYVLFVLCRSVHCLCVNVYCTTATGWQPNCSLTNISCTVWCILSFGWFSGIWILYAYVSEHSVCSIFIGGVSRKNNRDEIVGVFIREKVWLENSLSQLEGGGRRGGMSE